MSKAMTEYTAAKDALLIYAANVLKEHIRWSPTGPRVTDKIKEMIVAAQSPASALSPSSEPAEPKPSVVVSDEAVRAVALAICKSRSCEGSSCCQWPANRGRANCTVPQHGYDDAARAAMEAAAPYILSAQSTDTSYMVEQANKLIDQVKERDAEIERLKRDLATMTNNYRARTDASVDIARERNAARAEIERLLASTRRDAHHIRDLTSDLDLCRLEIKSLRHPDG